MADIAAGDVTYTLLTQRRTGDSRVSNRVRLAFGNSSLTVPASGIPLTKGKLGCPNIVESLKVVDQGTSGYVFQYDQSEEKLVVMRAPAQTHTHDLFYRDAAVADGATTRVNIGTNAMGANTGSNITVAGAASGVNGGVVSTTLAAAALTEASALAIAAQTIEVEVLGW
jgi:hypothetical protein